MKITLELPDDEVLEAALRYFPVRDGYPSTEDWCIAQILNAAASEEDDLTELKRTWDENLRARKPAAAGLREISQRKPED